MSTPTTNFSGTPTPTARPRSLRSLILRAGVFPALLVLYIWLAVGGSRRVGLVYDEPVHIVAGVYYNLESDYRFQPENGVLPQRLEALPWILAGVRPPALEGAAWEKADIWTLGTALMEQTRPHRDSLIWWSRLTTALAGAATLFLIYRWSLGIYGLTGAGITTALVAFCPNFVAHGGLATTDIWGVLGAVLSVLAWWRLCHRVSTGRVCSAGLAAGFFAVCKFSCVLLIPIVTALVIVRLFHKAPLPWSFGSLRGRSNGVRRIVPLATGGTVALGLAILVIWANYGFRYTAAPHAGGAFISDWSTMLIESPERVGLAQLGQAPEEDTVLLIPGTLQHAISFARDHHLLPEAWLYGLAFVGRNAQSRLSYFAEQYSLTGWWSYFPTAFLLKTPLGGLFALACAIAAWGAGLVGGRVNTAYRLAPIVALALVVLATAMSSRINIGLRHILPAIVALWMLCGAVVLIRRPRLRLVLLPLLLLGVTAQAVSTLRVVPHTLTYFNPLSGGAPDRWLVDSNLDWGQTLPELATWLKIHPEARPVYLSYFGTDSPHHYDIHATRFADFPFDRDVLKLPAELGPGWYCFSPTQFRRVYGDTRGTWTLAREKLYQETLKKVLEIASRGQATSTPESQVMLLMRFDNLRFARLCFYLQNRRPELRLPGGMMVFRLDEQDLSLAFYEPLSHVVKAIEARSPSP